MLCNSVHGKTTFHIRAEKKGRGQEINPTRPFSYKQYKIK